MTKIEFEGVTFEAGDTLPGMLAVQPGEALDPEKVRSSTRRLFASGRYRDIEVLGVRDGDGMRLIFSGTPQYFVGRVTIVGVKSEQLSSLLEFATKLDPGTDFTQPQIQAGVEGIKQSLQQNGYFEPKVTAATTVDKVGAQVNVTYTVNVGPQAQIGNVTMEGADPGMTLEDFRKKGKLKAGSKVSRDTVSNALSRLRTVYQKKDRLEATVSLQKQTYVPSRRALDYDFHANQGPEVKVLVEGVKLSKSRLRLLVPIFEEGTVDADLLNEGRYDISEYMQQQGYFGASVEVRQVGADTATERVVYTVDRGVKHKVLSVEIEGNKYFDTDLIKERLRVQKADAYQRSGRYSQQLVNQDVSSIQALYRANGFAQAKVTPEVKDTDQSSNGKQLASGQIYVKYKIEEGPQQKFGTVTLTGVDNSRVKDLKSLMNSQPGQPFSLITLSGDRDALLSYYVSHGFDQARVEIKQDSESTVPGLTDVTLAVDEGEQVFINHLLISGIEHTRPNVVDRRLRVHPGQPLNQAALLETQRSLYDLALFSEVNAAVQNPLGDAPRKNVLLQLTEAQRWDVTYGFGFEAQTGTPASGTISEASCIQLMLNPCQLNQEGSAGVSPRVSLDIARLNLRGSDNSLVLHTTFGLLEKVATLSYQDPHLFGSQNFSNTISGGYTDVQDITTFKSSTLQFGYHVTEKVKRADTLLYDWQFRLVKVDPNSLQVAADLIPLLSQPVRVGGPGFTWLHDTRQPNPLEAVKGRYLTVQEFVAWSGFGAQTDFNRVDGTYATYYQFGKNGRYVFARKTRLGFEQSYGVNPNVGNSVCAGVLLTTNPSCSAVPLPERLYAGGAASHRGFGINAAGPRDLQTGYPVGGTAAIVNTFELRLPPPVLPYVGSSVSFVLFHDMGNVFQNAKDLFPSFLRVSQPDRNTCKNVSGSIGTCSFNYYSHAVGVGARYKTPVGPIRVDFSYNLNPPIYPVIYDFYNNPPHVGQANHFNFFFSIGESF